MVSSVEASQPDARASTTSFTAVTAAGSPSGLWRQTYSPGSGRDASRRLASEVVRVRSTSAEPPSCAARETRTIAVVSGSTPSRTTSPNPPERASSSAARSPATGPSGRTRSGPSRQQAPATMWQASIQTERSPPDTVRRQAARSRAAAPGPGLQTAIRPRWNPPSGRTESRAVTPEGMIPRVHPRPDTASGKRWARTAWTEATREAGMRFEPAGPGSVNRTNTETTQYRKVGPRARRVGERTGRWTEPGRPGCSGHRARLGHESPADRVRVGTEPERLRARVVHHVADGETAALGDRR